MKENQVEIMHHSCSHLLAAAVLKLFPKTKLGIGPAIEDGFYYDFEFTKPIEEKDLAKISTKMKEIAKKKFPFIKEEATIEKAKKIFKDQPYKIELIEELAKEGKKKVSLYKSGDLIDLCAGPHLKNTSEIGPFKLLSIAGAYWRGSEKNKMLTRIYGTCFSTEKELQKYLWQIEEAKKRDHRKIGKELGLWTFSEYVGAGLPLFTPKGTLVRRLINEFVEELQSKQGIDQVWTPQIAKAELFKTSGHYDKYQENMFHVKSNYSDEEFFLKPMNCPQHIQIYASEPRSYKDLPIRFADFAMLYRDEKPGELSGLTRVRSFSQDDCHIFCREDQIIEEMNKALDMTKEILAVYGFSYRYRLSIRDPEHPEKYLGDEKTWQKAEQLCEKIMKERKIDYFMGVGEATFYGPKLDLIARDSLGRDWQLSTLQIDFFMPERFNLTYTDNKGRSVRTVMLHRAILGSPERFMAILIEHYAGAFPVWLSPIQTIVIPITDKQNKYGQEVLEKLKQAGIRAELDERGETTSAKIRDAEMQKIPYILVVGDKEIKAKAINVRRRGEKILGSMKLDKFLKLIQEDIAKKRQI
jgi:threonyl-tRNA synthetase